jgi:hypothetical protein
MIIVFYFIQIKTHFQALKSLSYQQFCTEKGEEEKKEKIPHVIVSSVSI